MNNYFIFSRSCLRFSLPSGLGYGIEVSKVFV